MKYFLLLLIMIFPIITTAQITVSSVSPANGAVNVPLSTTLSITFSEPFDQTKGMGYSNINAPESAMSITPDHRTLNVNMTLNANTAYFFIWINVVAEGGSRLAPFITYFTTGPSFPTTTISGTVQSGTTSVSPEKSIVFVTNINPMRTEGEPDFVMATFAEASGNYTIPYVKNGSYYIMAAKDVDGEEGIDPQEGNGPDVISNVDSVLVNSVNITGINLVLQSKKTFSEARTLAASYSTGLPAANYLRRVEGNNVDSTGKARNWDLYYVASVPTDGHSVAVDAFETRIESIDTSFARFLLQCDVFDPNPAIDASVFIANVENAGGREFRQSTPTDGYFNCTLYLGDPKFYFGSAVVPDPEQKYWLAHYIKDWYVGDQFNTDGKFFLGAFTTGEVLNVTSVENQQQNRPDAFALHQNYPNPFNPATKIEYRIGNSEFVSLKVYDVLGREVATLVNQQQSAGDYKAEFQGKNLPSGLYIYRLQTGLYSESRKMLLTK